MTAKAEARFLTKQLKAAANIGDPEYVAYLRAKQVELEQLVQQPRSPELGRKLPVLAAALRKQLAAQGEMEVLEGDVSGWAKLQEAQRFQYWEQLVLETAFDRETKLDRRRLGLSVNSFADCLVAVQLGAPETAAVIMQRLVGESREASNNYWAASTSALTFQARVYELVTGAPLEIEWRKLLPLGGYERLLSANCTGAKYREALAWACNEHIAQTQETKQVFQPFAYDVAVTMPVELICWRRYRRGQGLEHGSEGHPLLESPLAALDPPLGEPAASDLSKLLERMLPHVRAYLTAN